MVLPQESHHARVRGALRMTTEARHHDGENREMLGITDCTIRRRGGGVATSADRAALGPAMLCNYAPCASAVGRHWHTRLDRQTSRQH